MDVVIVVYLTFDVQTYVLILLDVIVLVRQSLIRIFIAQGYAKYKTGEIIIIIESGKK